MRTGVIVELPKLNAKNCDSKKRWLYGMYSWQPLQIERLNTIRENRRLELQFLRGNAGLWQRLRKPLLHLWPTIYVALPVLIFGCAMATGVLISVFVPPRGWRCSTNGEIYFAAGWFGSYIFSKLISLREQGERFFLMFCKDLTVTGGAIAWIFLTQRGWYNRPECYMREDKTGLVLPEQPDAYDQLQAGLRFRGSYVTILVLGIFFQAVLVPGLIYARYESTIWTLMQRDNSASELSDLGCESDDPKAPSTRNSVAPRARV